MAISSRGPLKIVMHIKYMIMFESEWSVAYLMFALPKCLMRVHLIWSLISL